MAGLVALRETALDPPARDERREGNVLGSKSWGLARWCSPCSSGRAGCLRVNRIRTASRRSFGRLLTLVASRGSLLRAGGGLVTGYVHGQVVKSVWFDRRRGMMGRQGHVAEMGVDDMNALMSLAGDGLKSWNVVHKVMDRMMHG